MPSAADGPGATDPHGIGTAMSRLSGGSRKAGGAAALVLSHALEDGESVSVLAQCRYLGAPAVVALTDRRLVFVNAREWEPDVVTVELVAGLTVQGWQDERHAALVFARGDEQHVVDRIGDRALAQELASGVRSRVGG